MHGATDPTHVHSWTGFRTVVLRLFPRLGYAKLFSDQPPVFIWYYFCYKRKKVSCIITNNSQTCRHQLCPSWPPPHLSSSPNRDPWNISSLLCGKKIADIWANPSAPCVDPPTAAMFNLYELMSSVLWRCCRLIKTFFLYHWPQASPCF